MATGKHQFSGGGDQAFSEASIAAISIFVMPSCHERTRCCRSIRAGYGSRQDMRGDLPRNAPLAPAPAIRAHLPPIVDDRAPQVVCLSLIIGRDLERTRLFMLEHRGTRVTLNSAVNTSLCLPAG